jgi:hypothetical protein
MASQATAKDGLPVVIVLRPSGPRAEFTIKAMLGRTQAGWADVKLH